jgi:hypothetical protein
VSADYSQIELRIMAHLSQDTGMLNAFANNEDIHRATAAEIFGVDRENVDNEQRRYAKVINFGLIYGMSAFGLAQNLNIERSAAQSYIERYFARYPGVREYMQSTREIAKQKGYVETYFGRRLWVPEINSPNGMRRAGAERAAINAPMQGTAADLIKLAMIAVQKWLTDENLQSKLIMQVHDELVLEVPETELDLVKQKLPQLMQHVAKLDVPLLAEVGVGHNWESAHERTNLTKQTQSISCKNQIHLSAFISSATKSCLGNVRMHIYNLLFRHSSCAACNSLGRIIWATFQSRLPACSRPACNVATLCSVLAASVQHPTTLRASVQQMRLVCQFSAMQVRWLKLRRNMVKRLIPNAC